MNSGQRCIETTSVGVCDSSEGTDPRADASPVAVSPVLPGTQVVHPALVVGLIVQQPVAVHHVAGVEVGHAEVVLDVGAVVHQLVHLAGHVEAFVEPHPVGTSVLTQDRKTLLIDVQESSLILKLLIYKERALNILKNTTCINYVSIFYHNFQRKPESQLCDLPGESYGKI